MAGIGAAGSAMVSAVRIYLALATFSLLLSLLWRGFALPSTTIPDGFPVAFYQHVIGEIDGRSCPSYPVCSLYAKQSLARYGALIGSWLMLDRLIHEADDLHRGPWLLIDGEKRLNDPLRRNAGWLTEHK